jgi:Tol biopolymer transport system component/predicted Ser/Thr protein kinase
MERDLVGTTLSHYRVLSFEGKGGMKHVYRAYDERLQRHVAIKVLRGESRDEAERRRIRNEALILSRLNHANVEIVHDFDSQDGIDFLVTEFIQGTSLDARIGTRPLPERQVIALGCQIADALGAAHAKGIVHRDLKPANIIVTTEGVVKVLDFGIAKMLAGGDPDETTYTWSEGEPARGEVYTDPRGTLPYMAPEALTEGRVDARTDLYALGVVLFEMVTGRRPFQHDHPTGLIREICQAAPPAPTTIHARVSRRLEDLILKSLEKKPELRYQSALEMKVDLMRAESGPIPREILPVRVSPRERVAAWARTKGRTWIAAAGAGALALLVWIVTHPPRPAPVPAQRQLTRMAAAVTPALSPDGNYFAFVDQSTQGTHRVYVQSVAGGEPREVFSNYLCTGLRWSPDGSRLLCLSARGPTQVPRVHLVPWPGGQVRSFDSYGLVAAWAPDGRSFASALYSERMIYVTDEATGERTSFRVEGSVSQIRDLDWSPNGSRIAVLTHDAQGHNTVWTMTPAGKDVRVAFTDSLELGAPRWTPDGRGLYLLRSNEEAWDLVRVDLRSRKSSVLLSGLETEPAITLSRDGGKLLYARRSTRRNLWMLDPIAKGSSRTWTPRLLTSGGGRDTHPRFSPGGNEIVFARLEGAASEIFLIPANGGTARRLTYLDRWTGDPSWSPDGSHVAFSSGLAGRFRVHRMSRSGGPVHAWRRTDAAEMGKGLAWCASGQILYPAPSGHNYTVLDPGTEKERPLLSTSIPGKLFQPSVSPDGLRAAFLWNEWPSTAVRIFSLDGALLATADAGLPLGWDRGGRDLLILRTYPEPPRIIRYDTKTGTSGDFYRFPAGERVVEGSFSPSGNGLVYAVVTTESDIWLIENVDRP